MSLRTTRRLKGLTQEALAAKSGVDQTSISSIEVGKNRNPSWETVSKLAKALGVSPDELFPIDAAAVRDDSTDRRQSERRTADLREAR
jgi:transcriptional regulator with XRE-family HTH domain